MIDDSAISRVRCTKNGYPFTEFPQPSICGGKADKISITSRQHHTKLQVVPPIWHRLLEYTQAVDPIQPKLRFPSTEIMIDILPFSGSLLWHICSAGGGS